MGISKFNPTRDYLKYWRVVRYFIKAKYKIGTSDLDLLLFLYSEVYFSKDKFNEFDELLSWEVNRFDRLLRDGWIIVFRKNYGKKKALYEISFKGKRMINSLYDKLNGNTFPESKSINPMFLAGASYQDKVYRNMIKEMNTFIRQQRRLAQQ
jgi:hypothetical protein